VNILSVFDGIGGARLALEKSKIEFEKYYSSEIDKHAIKVLKDNYEDVIHLGDIKNLKKSNFPKIDLLIGGSPCQDLSNAYKGKGLKGEKSELFYEFIRVLNEFKPRFFLLENVKNKWGSLMSEIVGVDFLEINSKYFSAQSRPRYYWTNIPVDLKEIYKTYNDKSIRDILEKDVDEKYFLDDCVVAKILNIEIKNNYKNRHIKKILTVPKELINDNERQRRIYDIKGKSPTILARSDTPKILIKDRIRKLTPLECERLQGIPDDYTASCSNTQRYKMIGNSFTVNVIAFLLKNLDKEPIKRRKSKKINDYIGGSEAMKQLQLF